MSYRYALIFALAVAVCNGFARFAYALILPVMRADLGWDYALSGWLNTANSLGYMLGGLTGMLLLTRWAAGRLFSLGLVVTGITVLAVGLTQDLYLMMLYRFLSGVGSAWVFACGGAMVAAHYSHDQHKTNAGTAIALYFSGGGVGIFLSGLLMFPLLSGRIHWQEAWLILGLASGVLIASPVFLAWRSALPVHASHAEPLPWRHMKTFTVAYCLFGLGYIVYMTFVVAWFKEMRLGTNDIIALWVLMGVACTASGWLWRQAMAHWWPGHTFLAACLCTALGSALPLLANTSGAWWVLALSVGLVGGAFFMVPGSVTAYCRAVLPAALWAKGMNYFTMIFALGQALGPILAGEIADRLNLNLAMLTGALILCLGAVLASLQHRRPLR
ncbi:MAG: hypothetical protein RLZZ502_455 [Pseudomonadota bacterium]|jgi:MFS family permease